MGSEDSNENRPKQYWKSPMEYITKPHADLEMRASMAWELISHFGSVAAIYHGKEDRTGRAMLDLQSPEELVTRCFAIADAFANMAEERSEIRYFPESALGAYNLEKEPK